MNRRSFLAGMLKAGVAAAFLPGAGRLWKRTTNGVLVPNPDYVNAPYEMTLYIHRGVFESVEYLRDPYPRRYHIVNGVFHEVPPQVWRLDNLQPTLLHKQDMTSHAPKVISREVQPSGLILVTWDDGQTMLMVPMPKDHKWVIPILYERPAHAHPS